MDVSKKSQSTPDDVGCLTEVATQAGWLLVAAGHPLGVESRRVSCTLVCGTGSWCVNLCECLMSISWGNGRVFISSLFSLFTIVLFCFTNVEACFLPHLQDSTATAPSPQSRACLRICAASLCSIKTGHVDWVDGAWCSCHDCQAWQPPGHGGSQKKKLESAQRRRAS